MLKSFPGQLTAKKNIELKTPLSENRSEFIEVVSHVGTLHQ